MMTYTNFYPSGYIAIISNNSIRINSYTSKMCNPIKESNYKTRVLQKKPIEVLSCQMIRNIGKNQIE